MEKPTEYTDPAFGGEFWRDIAATHGLDEALAIGGDYLKTQLKLNLPPEEKQFCRAFFAAMHEAAAGKTDPAKLVYPYSFEAAVKRMETPYFHDSCDRNRECTHAINAAINGSRYETHQYNFDIAAMTVIHRHGFQRVNAVLAFCIQQSASDGRYSDANKRWAQGFDLPDIQARLNAHPVLVESFTNHVRRLYDELGAERYALPGQPECDEVVEGYIVTRAITFEDKRGYAIATHPWAGHVCWQFKTDNGKRDYFWGHYTPDEKDAINRYIARVVIHMSNGAREEPARVKTPAPQTPSQRKPRDRGDR